MQTTRKRLAKPLEETLVDFIDIPLAFLRVRADISHFIDTFLGPTVFDTLCDLGCGNGRDFGPLLRKHAKYLVGFDLKPEIVPLASETYDKVILADIRSFDEHMDGFDAVTMFFSIEHLTKDDGLTLLRRIIPKTKFLCITTDTKYAPSGQEMLGSPHNSDVHKLSGCPWTPLEFQQLGFQCWLVKQDHQFWKRLWGDHILAIRKVDRLARVN